MRSLSDSRRPAAAGAAGPCDEVSACGALRDLPPRQLLRALPVACLLLLLALPGSARPAEAPSVEQRALAMFDGADRLGNFQGEPRAAPVFAGPALAGYVFLTDDIAPIPAYSGRPISTLVGIDIEGRIAGLAIVDHSEPILAAGVTERDLQRYIEQYVGLDATTPIRVGGQPEAGVAKVDAITGATITTMVLNASITRAARQVAASRELPLPAAKRDRIQAPAADPEGEREPPLWVQVWRNRVFRIAVLAVGLFSLTAILVFQDWLTRKPRLIQWLRTSFLVYTLVFIGWYGLAQLSVINVLTFSRSLMHDFSWDTFLIDPMMFLLWSYVAVTILLWGRGVFCGWLCPFGALQELVNKAAQRLKLPQLPIPAVVHERLLAIKYIILLGLFALSLHSMSAAVRYAEVEPFKTAINMHFMREWQFVLYAGAMVVISAFDSKFYCKYLCSLGAALTIPSHFRIFDWLRRRKECGNPCQICAVRCPSQAIRPHGDINMKECHYCLDCQVIYWDVYTCPPLVEKRKRLERQGRRLEVRVTRPQ